MKNKTVLTAAFFVAVGSCFAQEKVDETRYFRLDFSVREMDAGKVVNARSYSITMAADNNSVGSSIRSGGKIPVPSTSGQQAPFTYVETGVNIDCRFAKELGDKLTLNITADISSAGSSEKVDRPPLIRNTKWNSKVLVPLRKPTVLFSSDDVGSKMQMQLEITATPIQ